MLDTDEMLCRVIATQEAHGEQLDRVEKKVDEAWRWSNQHRTGLSVLLVVGATTLTVLGIAKGWLFGK